MILYNTEAQQQMNTIEFLPKPFEIPPEKRLTAYRFNLGNNSPYFPSQWNYDSRAVRTAHPEGLFALANCESAIGQVIERFRVDITGEDLRETIILRLEIDSDSVKYQNENEICFTRANMTGRLSLEEFFLLVFPQYTPLLHSYNTAKLFPSKQNLDLFNKCLNIAQMHVLNVRMSECIKNGRHIEVG